MPGMREFSPGNRCCPGQLERKAQDTSEKLWLEQRNFPPYSTKTPGSYRTRRSPRPSTEAENSTENQGFPMDFPWIFHFFSPPLEERDREAPPGPSLLPSPHIPDPPDGKSQ